MYDKESFSQDIGQIRECIIPNVNVKFVKLELGQSENGLVIDYEFKPENKKSKFMDSVIVPITMRKYMLYLQSRAS